MPHFHIEYSSSLEAGVDVAALCETVRSAAAEVDAFPVVGIRVRATRVDHYAIADGNPDHAFIDLSIRLREGRTVAVKRAAVTSIFEAMKEFLAEAFQTRSIALSAEIRDINAALSPKFGTIRDHLEEKT